MRYWDTSALVPLIVDEVGTPLARAWVAQDPGVVTWAFTLVEIASAVERRAREGALSDEVRRQVMERALAVGGAWGEIVDLLAVRSRALPLLRRHPLRAADAAQLGAALVAAEGNPTTMDFVCLDRALAKAAELEGFRVLGWPA